MLKAIMPKPVLARALVLATLGCAACSWTFDNEAPDLPLLGKPPPVDSLPRFNKKPVTDEYMVRASDGAVWLLMTQIDQSWRAVRLDTPEVSDEFTVDQAWVAWRALYLAKATRDTSGKTIATALTVRAVDEHPGTVYTIDGDLLSVLDGGSSRVFAYWTTGNAMPGAPAVYNVVRRDNGYKRTLPLPAGVPATTPFTMTRYFFDGRGDNVYDVGPDNRLRGHSTRAEHDVDLGVRPSTLQFQSGAPNLITCGMDGVRLVPLAGGQPDVVLDTTACLPLVLVQHAGFLYYEVAGELRKAALDGASAPVPVQRLGDHRLLVLETNGDRVIYSTDPSTRFVHGAGDGWLGDWRFMERGLFPSFSGDQKRLRWLEHAAQGSAAGVLTSAPVPGGSPLVLARNVRQFDELDDGRVLSDANHAYNGTYNRIIVVDEARREARWVAEGVNNYQFIPYHDDLLVDVVTGATGHDVSRVSIPPPGM